MKKFFVLLLMTFSVLSACSAAKVEDDQSIETGIYSINKNGSITLTIGPESMKKLGYEPADIISVRIGDAEIEMPIGTNYADADSGEPICCFKRSNSKGRDVVVLAINCGNLAESLGIAEMHETDEDPGFEWVFVNGLDESVPVCISMAEKQGYADEYAMHQVGNTRSNKREDYAYLSDAEFANFRAVETTGMGRNTLYRSSSPIDPALERNDEADNALRDAGIRTVMNMADSEQSMKRFADFGLTSYSQCDIIALDMTMTYDSDDFRKDLADGFRYIASHEGPYLIHCVEGKDRTGYAAAILECLMGASADEVVNDYMITYYNFYGIEPGTDQYKQIAESNIEAFLAKTFGIKSIYDDGVDLRSCSEKYLKEIGMNDDEIASLREGLALSY
jgi:protein tyrosine/serine phosphatase